MSKNRDTSKELLEALHHDMPPAPDEAALARVRTSAMRRHAGMNTGFRTHPWFAVSGAALALTLVALATAVLIPRAITPAFAADKAVEALSVLADTEVLHIEGTLSETRRSERDDHDARADINQRQEFWVYPARAAIRGEIVNLADGSLDSMSVQVDDKVMQFQNDVRYGTEESERLSTYAAVEDATVLDGIINRMRARIADGSASVTSSETINGEEYWVVEYRAPVAYPTSFHSFSVTMRKSDYRIHAYAANTEYLDEMSGEAVAFSATFNVIERVEPETLPADFFTFDAVRAVADRERPIPVQ